MQSSTVIPNLNHDEGLGRKKTMFVMVTVVGCIAILCPMLFGSSSLPPKQHHHHHHLAKDYRSGSGSGAGLNGGSGLRQERPPHLRPDGIHPAMRERGRAIPTTQTVPIVDRPRTTKDSPPRIVEGRPGPIPGMRPPMGAGSVQQPQTKGGSSMGFIMPLYTIGIIAFFLYTIMKLVFKKQSPNAPYGPVSPDPQFRKEVFGEDSTIYSKKHDEATNPKIVVTAIQGLIDAADEQLKIRENATDLNKESSETSEPSSPSSPSQNGNISNGHVDVDDDLIDEDNKLKKTMIQDERVEILKEDLKKISNDLIRTEKHNEEKQNLKSSSEKKKRDNSAERIVTVLGMELTASCEGGQRWSRPSTPVFFSHHQHSSDDETQPEPQSIYLEGSLPHESQILVADSEVHTEKMLDSEYDGSEDEPAVILSSKMTLSLINLSSCEDKTDKDNNTEDDESPLGDDIEIIDDEKMDENSSPDTTADERKN